MGFVLIVLSLVAPYLDVSNTPYLLFTLIGLVLLVIAPFFDKKFALILLILSIILMVIAVFSPPSKIKCQRYEAEHHYPSSGSATDCRYHYPEIFAE